MTVNQHIEAALDAASPQQEECERQEIPREYWREVPCGHPPDPVAMYGRDGEPVCHCGCILDQQDGIEVEEAPGPIIQCSKCGCAVAVPPDPTASSLPAVVDPQQDTESEERRCDGRRTQPDKRGATSAAGCPGCSDCQPASSESSERGER